MPSRPLTEAEKEHITQVLRSSMSKCLFVLGLRTGFRISELLSLCVKDVLTQREGIISDTLTVRRAAMKGTRVSRSVVLHDKAKESLLIYLKDNPRLLNSPESKLFPISRFAAHRILKQACKEAGVEGKVSTHSMRKSFAMRVYEKTGKDVVAVQRALGHVSLASTTKYLSLGQDIIDKAILED